MKKYARNFREQTTATVKRSPVDTIGKQRQNQFTLKKSLQVNVALHGRFKTFEKLSKLTFSK